MKTKVVDKTAHLRMQYFFRDLKLNEYCQTENDGLCVKVGKDEVLRETKAGFWEKWNLSPDANIYPYIVEVHLIEKMVTPCR